MGLSPAGCRMWPVSNPFLSLGPVCPLGMQSILPQLYLFGAPCLLRKEGTPHPSFMHSLPQAAHITLSLKSNSAWRLFFSHSMVTLPPSSMVMVPYRIPEMQLVLGFNPESLHHWAGKEGM